MGIHQGHIWLYHNSKKQYKLDQLLLYIFIFLFFALLFSSTCNLSLGGRNLKFNLQFTKKKKNWFDFLLSPCNTCAGAVAPSAGLARPCDKKKRERKNKLGDTRVWDISTTNTSIMSQLGDEKWHGEWQIKRPFCYSRCAAAGPPSVSWHPLVWAQLFKDTTADPRQAAQSRPTSQLAVIECCQRTHRVFSYIHSVLNHKTSWIIFCCDWLVDGVAGLSQGFIT